MKDSLIYLYKKHLRDYVPVGVKKMLHGLRNREKLLGMTSVEEQKYYREEAKNYLGKPGVIVDLGCWMGATTIAFARGLDLKKGKPSPEIIHAYDQFIWSNWMSKDTYESLTKSYKVGDDFYPDVKELLYEYGDNVNLHKENLKKYVWNKGGIKILLVDIMKGEELSTAVALSFYPFLLKGSIVIHQDFSHLGTPWVHIIQYRLRDYFKLRQEVRWSPTVSFELKKPISRDKIKEIVNFENITDEEVEAAFKYSFSLVSPEAVSLIAGAHVLFYVRIEEKEKARSLFENYTKTIDMSLSHEVELLKTYLV